jgi:hypothetical protein
MKACWSWIVADAVPGADETEGLLAVELVGAGLQVQVAVGVLDVRGRGDRDPAEFVDQLLEAAEVDFQVVVHADVGHGLDGLDGTGRATGRVRGVEHHVRRGVVVLAVGVGALGAVDQGVARDGDHGGLPVALVHVDDHRGVGAGAAVVGAAAELPVGAGAGVGAQDEDVLGAVVGLRGPLAAEDLVDVDALDVAVELEVHVAGPGAAHHDDPRGDPRHGQQALAAPAAGCAAISLAARFSGYRRALG